LPQIVQIAIVEESHHDLAQFSASIQALNLEILFKRLLLRKRVQESLITSWQHRLALSDKTRAALETCNELGHFGLPTRIAAMKGVTLSVPKKS